MKQMPHQSLNQIVLHLKTEIWNKESKNNMLMFFIIIII